MAQLDEQHRQIILKADEICKRLTPYTDYMVIMHDALMQMARFVEDLFAQSPWVSVEKRLPKKGQSCFLANFDKRRCGYGKFCADDGMVTRWERREGDTTRIYCLHEVTHWMPIHEL